MNLVPNKQLLRNVPLESTKYRKKRVVCGQTIGDVHCPTCRNEKCVYISTNKTTSFYDCKKCKTCCNVLNSSVLNIPKNRQLCCLVVTEHIALQERRLATTKKMNHLHF